MKNKKQTLKDLVSALKNNPCSSEEERAMIIFDYIQSNNIHNVKWEC